MGAALAAASGLGFGAFQSINRRAAAGIRSAYVSTFLQLVVALVVLVVASVTAADPGRLSSATAATIAWFGAAGAVHFFCGWTLLNMSQERIGAVDGPQAFVVGVDEEVAAEGGIDHYSGKDQQSCED